MKAGSITLKIIALLLMNDTLDSFAQLLIKKGLLQGGMTSIGLGNILEFAGRSLTTPYVLCGMLVYVASFFVWIVVLSRIEVSIAIPISSLCYILTPLFAVVFLHERVSAVRWLGIFLIIAGIYFVSESKRRSMEAAS